MRLLAIFLIFLVSPASADSLQTEDISADAKWFVHVDIEKALASRIGNHFRSQLEKEKDFRKVKAAITITEFDPFKDLHSVTAYNTSMEEEQAVVLIRGKFDREKVLAAASAENELIESRHGKFIIYQGGNEHDQGFGSFFSDGLIVIGTSRERVELGLDVLTKHRENLADRGDLHRLVPRNHGAFFVAAARGIGRMAELQGEARVMKKVDSAALAVGESEEHLFVQGRVSTLDDRMAEQLHAVAKGALAMVQMVGEEELQEAAEIIKNLEVEREGRMIEVRISIPTKKIFEMIEDEY